MTEPEAQAPSVLSDVPLSSTVRAALDHSADQCDAGRPLQTGMVLAALISADGHGTWDGVWPSYDGTAESLLTADDDENAAPSGASWQGTQLSEDLLAALELLAQTARRYKMDPVQPGALALALASIDSGSASRHLIRLSGYPRDELIDRIQSDLLGTALEAFGDTTDPEAQQDYSRPSARAVLSGIVVAILCTFAAWQAFLLVLGSLTGAVVLAGLLALMLDDIRGDRSTASARSQRTGRWSWSLLSYFRPLTLFALLLGVAFMVFLVGNHRRFEKLNLYPVGILVGSAALAFILLLAGFIRRGEPSSTVTRKKRRSLLAAGARYYRLPVTGAVTTGAVVTLMAMIARLGYLSTPLGTFSSLPYRWLRAALTGSGLGGWFPLWYWPVLAGVAAAAAGYLAGSAVWAASTARYRTKARAWRRRAVSAGIIGLAVIAIGNLPASPLAYPAITGPLEVVPFRYPSYPTTLALDNTDSLVGLHWTRTGPADATAVGMIYLDNCSPDCASGKLHVYPVEVSFLDPRRCAVENAYIRVTADVFTEIHIRPLAGHLPRYLAGRFAIVPECA